VHFDLAKAGSAELDEIAQVFRAVLFLGKKIRVARRAPVCVAMTDAQARIPFAPAAHSLALESVVGPPPTRLEMIDEAKHDVLRPGVPRPPPY
jgi:hypothetical protein